MEGLYSGMRSRARLSSGHLKTVNGIAYSTDGHQIASCGYDGSIRVWDSSNGEILAALSGHLSIVTSVEYSPTGDFIASGSIDGTVRLWRVGGKVLSHGDLNRDQDKWKCVALSPNGEQVVTCGSQGKVQFWETLSGKPGLTITDHTYVVGRVAFSPCGQRIAAACSDRVVRLLCARTGTTMHVFSGHQGTINSVTFSPDGCHIVSASQDTTIRT